MENDTAQSSSDGTFDSTIHLFITAYKVPIIIGIVGVVFVGYALFFMHSRQAKDEVVFTEQSATLSAARKIVIDIEGAVEKPGVYTIENDGRIEDLLILAGGLSSSADRVWTAKYLNRASVLSDGMKLYIPSLEEKKAEAGSTLGTADSKIVTDKIDVNTASISELDKLPGVGESTARKIIDGRPYQSIEELKTKKVVGNAVFEKIKDLISTY